MVENDGDEKFASHLRAEVHLVGDGISGEWVTWRWGHRAGATVARIAAWATARDMLSAALPRQMPTHRRQLRLDGPLASPKDERELSSELARILIPEQLRREILHAHEITGELVRFKVAPSPSATQVPWGLLSLNEDTRLLDVADVSWLAPLTPRDVLPNTDVQVGADDLPPLYVIDPVLTGRTGQIMNPQGHENWRQRLHGLGAQNVYVHDRVTLVDLEDRLRTPRSRMVLVGHCITAPGTGGIRFQLSDATHLSPSQLLHNTDRDGERSLAWPMPKRVAIVACASGVDSQTHESFGLTTAMLVNGARIVVATLWPLPTDATFEQAGAGPRFTNLAEAADEALRSADPVTTLNNWQRSQLAAWRTSPSINTSPLAWAAVAIIHAPDRTIARNSPTAQ